MSEKPILFSGPMVRAILDGRKKQTRRVINMDRLRVCLERTVKSDAILCLDPSFKPMLCPPGEYKATMNQHGAVSVITKDGRLLGVKPGEFHFICPYADGDTHLGDYGNGKRQWTITPLDSRLWVRETFYKPDKNDTGFAGVIADYIYRADYDYREDRSVIGCDHWKPSIFMPRWASRITLEITGVRVERLQDISEADAKAEGIRVPDAVLEAASVQNSCGAGEFDTIDWSAVDDYEWLWDSINGKKHPWKSNPWVWVIEFKKL